MTFTLGDKVQLTDGRVGVVTRVYPNDTYQVAAPDDPVMEATWGHRDLRPGAELPIEPSRTDHVPAARLVKVA